MADKTVPQRVKRQRVARLDAGWEEVRVWIPTAENANEIRKLAAQQRRHAEELSNLTSAIKSMSRETVEAITEAIIRQGSPAYTTPSGPVLDVLGQLAASGEPRRFLSRILDVRPCKASQC
jgi:hypothetical protein